VKYYFKHFGYVDQNEVFCEVCGKQAQDLHHIEKRNGKNDNVENIIALCRYHHNCSHFIEHPYLQKEGLQIIHNRKL